MMHIDKTLLHLLSLLFVCVCQCALHAQAPAPTEKVVAAVQATLDCYKNAPTNCTSALLAQALDPQDLKSALLQLDGKFQQEGNMLAQMEILETLCKHFPHDSISWVWHDKMARIYKKAWRNYQKAAEQLHISAQLEKKTHVRQEKVLAEAFSWYMAESYEQAQKNAHILMDQTKNKILLGAATLLNALCLLRQNKLQDAQESVAQFLSEYPEFPLHRQAKMLMGYICLQQGNLKEAAALLGDLAKDPGEGLAPKLAEILADLPDWANTAKPEDKLENTPTNLLMISLDTVRADHLGCYGYGRQSSPNIDALAAQGTTFENCSSVSSWTKTAHATVFTGLDASVHGAMNHTQTMAPNCYTLAQALQSADYSTIGIISAPPLNSLFGFGKGFDYYDDFTYDLDRQNDLFFRSEENTLQIHSGFTGSLITETALRAYDRLCAQRPFFLFVNYFDAHHNFLPPYPHSVAYGQPYYGTRYGFVDAWLQSETPLEKADPPVDVQRLHDLYDGEIQYVDKQVGALVEKLKKENRFDDTLIVLFGDHGEEFMEHGQLTHGKTLYNEVLRVPLIFIGPGVPKGKKVSTPVSQIDIMPTLLNLLGEPIPGGINGIPLLPDLPNTETRTLFAKLDLPGYKLAAILEPPYKLILNLENHQAELFNLNDDPGESKNIRDSQLDTAMRMLDALMLWDLQGGDSNKRLGASQEAEAAKPIAMIESVLERLRALGYVQ